EKYQKTYSLLYDEDIQNKIVQFLNSNKFQLNISQICNYIIDEIFPSVRIKTKKTISKRIVQRWLGKLGWKYQHYQKGLYIDGHERADVIEHRYIFLEHIKQFELLMPSWLDNLTQQINPVLPKNEKLHILVTHDKTRPSSKQPLCPKSLGGSLMVSEFLCDTISRLQLNNIHKELNSQLLSKEQIPNEACCIIHPNAHRDSYWTREDVANQLKNKAIPIFKAMHPNCIAVFAFDNNNNHEAFAKDALVQEIVFSDETLKGMHKVLEEREPDFMNQKSLLEEIVEKAGHKIIFYPKFYCELNYIENYWGATKRYIRANCNYSFNTLKNTVSAALESVSLIQIR
ncbi:11312_t:CDS:2, partial [Scutellospora calospora]